MDDELQPPLVEVVDRRPLAGLVDELVRVRAGQVLPVLGDAAFITYGPVAGTSIVYDYRPVLIGGSLKLVGVAWGESLTVGTLVQLTGLPADPAAVTPPGGFAWPADSPLYRVDCGALIKFGAGDAQAVAELDVTPGNAATFHADAVQVELYQCGAEFGDPNARPRIGAFVTYGEQEGVGLRTLDAFALFYMADETNFVGVSAAQNMLTAADYNIDYLAQLLRALCFPEL